MAWTNAAQNVAHGMLPEWVYCTLRCERKQLWDRFFRCVAADGPVRRAVTKTTQRVVASKSIGLAGVQESTGDK